MDQEVQGQEVVPETQPTSVDAPDEGAQRVEVDVSGGGGPGQGGVDYISRIKSDPEFAADQVRKRDSQLNEANQKLKKLGALEEYVNAAGGVEGLLRYVQTGNTVLSNPQIAEIVKEFQTTGTIRQAEQPVEDDPESADPYITDDPVYRALQKEIAELKANEAKMQSELQQRFAQTDARTYQSGIESNIGKVIERFGKTPELREQIEQAINAKVQAGQAEAQMGDQRAVDMLKTLAGDNGVKTFQMMIADVLLDEGNLRLITQSTESERAQQLSKQSTGEPSHVATAGGGAPVEIAQGPNFVREALARRTRDANKSSAIWDRPT